MGCGASVPAEADCTSVPPHKNFAGADEVINEPTQADGKAFANWILHEDCRSPPEFESEVARVLVVSAEIKEQARDKFEQIMQHDVMNQRNEEGCMFLDFFRSSENTLQYVWVEGWRDSAAQKEHAETEWFKQWAEFEQSPDGFAGPVRIDWAFNRPDQAGADELQVARWMLGKLGMPVAYHELGEVAGKDPRTEAEAEWSSHCHFAFSRFSKKVSPHTLWMKEASFPVQAGHALRDG